MDRYNGRFGKTPEFPEGVYAYFTCIDATEQGNPVFPYIIGPSFNSSVDKWNLASTAVQQNIPTGVIRYRDPYENVDICLLYTSPSPRDATLSRMPSSA